MDQIHTINVRLIYLVRISGYGFTYRHDFGQLYIFVYNEGNQITTAHISNTPNLKLLKDYLGIK